ncbi:polysaccharide pyruvyl transferase family protein [Demequina iriomotensis]|uniref:polysaccharide pyruvyl transferase family protein n=1 Tax=Demequina iriomotensis TaxID=1536641 RepID=UPI000785356C|nr:polysaccharide pyruvyl transferase family protein [Demequina iriomotensis]
METSVLNSGPARVRRATAQLRFLADARKSGRVAFFWWNSRNFGDASMWFAAERLFAGTPLVRYPDFLTIANPVGSALARNIAFDLTICGGGTLLSKPFFRVLEELRERSGRMVALGTGIGSPGIETGSQADRGLDPDLVTHMHAFDELHLRGPHSVDAARSSGFAGPLTQSGDMVLALTPDEAFPHEGDGLVFVVGYDEVPEVRDYSEQLVAAALQRGTDVTFLSMNPVDDARALELHRRHGRPVMLSNSWSTPEHFMGTLAQFGSMVTFRLHGAVYASMMGLPNVLVQTVRKMSDFATTVGADDFCVPLGSLPAAELMALADPRRAVDPIRTACLDGRAHLRTTAEGIMAGR